MKKIVTGLLVLTAFLAGHPAHAFVDGFSPYVGVDALWWTATNKSHTHGNFHRNYWGGNVFLGGRFCDVWGLEVGYSWTGKKSRSHSALINGTTISGRSRNNFNQYYLDLNGYLPVDECWDLIGSIGVAGVQHRPHVENLFVNGGARGTHFASHRKTKTAFRLGVGAQVMATECFGIRGIVRWVSTSSSDVTVINPINNTSVSFKPFRNSILASLGIFWRF